MKTKHAVHAHSQSRQDSIIQAALTCFNQVGYTNTGIADICRVAEASTGSVYHHFGSKSGLAAAVYLSGIRDYQTGMLAALRPELSARDGVFTLITFHLNWVVRHPAWARYLFQHRHAEFMGGEAVENTLRELNARFSSSMAGWFGKHIEAGRIRVLPRDLFLSLLLGPCQEFARQYLAGYTVTDVDRAAVEIAAGAWAALSPGPPT